MVPFVLPQISSGKTATHAAAEATGDAESKQVDVAAKLIRGRQASVGPEVPEQDDDRAHVRIVNLSN